MNYKLEYAYDLCESVTNFVYSMPSMRITLNILAAISTISGVILRSQETAGKINTMKNIASSIGRSLYIVNFEEDAQYNSIIYSLLGASK